VNIKPTTEFNMANNINPLDFLMNPSRYAATEEEKAESAREAAETKAARNAEIEAANKPYTTVTRSYGVTAAVAAENERRHNYSVKPQDYCDAILARDERDESYWG
jgi:hypothetical protein